MHSTPPPCGPAPAAPQDYRMTGHLVTVVLPTVPTVHTRPNRRGLSAAWGLALHSRQCRVPEFYASARGDSQPSSCEQSRKRRCVYAVTAHELALSRSMHARYMHVRADSVRRCAFFLHRRGSCERMAPLAPRGGGRQRSEGRRQSGLSERTRLPPQRAMTNPPHRRPR